MKEGVDVSVQPDKSLTEMEKELLGKFQVWVGICKQLFSLIYTVGRKKTWQQTFINNSGKS